MSENSHLVKFSAAIGLFFLLAGGWSLAGGNAVESLPKAELGKLPELAFGRNEAFEAAIHPLDKQKAVLVVEGERYAGFRFTAPEMLDGPIEWLSVPAGAERDGVPWILLSEEGKVIATSVPTVGDVAAFPRIAAQFPHARGIFRHEIQMEALKGGGRYSAVQVLADGQPAPVAVSMTVASVIGRFQFGNLNPKIIIPARQLATGEVIAAVLKAREQTSDEAASDLLMREMDLRSDDNSAYDSLFYAVWREAQMGSGRLDIGWQATLFDALFTSGWKHRYYRGVIDVTSNLTGTLSDAGRHGRVTEVLDWWCEAQRLGGYRMDSTSYPDLGPAFPMLPEVRKRDIPELVAFSKAVFEGDHPRSMMESFSLNTAAAFLKYGEQLHRAGRWRESLEWRLWIHGWASVEDGSAPRPLRVPVWNSSLIVIQRELRWLGFAEEALALVEQGIAAPYGNSYRGRDKLILARDRFELLMELDRPVPDLIGQIEKLIKESEANIHLNITAHQSAKVTLAKALIRENRIAEGVALLEKLVKEGSLYARNILLTHRITTGDLENVEEELLAILKAFRETGNKSGETWLYREYADFLEKSGRFQEELLMRRELLRLYRSFDYFTFLPFQLAKLASLLERMGDAEGGKSAADEARALLARGRIPVGNARKANEVLAGLNAAPGLVNQKPEKAPSADFQPGRSVVIPIKGVPWTTLLTLANPGSLAEGGTLSADGIPLAFTKDEEHGDVLASLGKGAEEVATPLPLRLEPGSYQLIKITADENFATEGEVTLTWTSDRAEARVEAKVSIEAPESGVSSSIIQAGNYRLNPFYGVPIHHHYVTKDKATESLPLRFVTSNAARVEVYALDGTPLSIDAQGNGSLRDRGDQLFGATDRQGNLLLSLANGAASFMILLYPGGPLPEEGITLDVEVYQNDAWTLHSQNRILP